jgi:hypothetical protein
MPPTQRMDGTGILSVLRNIRPLDLLDSIKQSIKQRGSFVPVNIPLYQTAVRLLLSGLLLAGITFRPDPGWAAEKPRTEPVADATEANAAANGGAGYATPLPRSCFDDFSDTLSSDITKRSFLTVGDDGHFHWGAGGPRARFWGINVSSTRLNIPDAQIEQVVATFSRTGINLVRLEAIDNRNCLLGSVDAPDSLHFDPAYLDRLDRWMDVLRRHGICYYLDLLDFRTFKAGDGVLNADQLDRGARPYALFDSYLIQLQKDYAGALLTHLNPYSGVRPVDDPALAMVEICNESGFFLYPEKLEGMVQPYQHNLLQRWNAWLRAKYGTRQKLQDAWGNSGPWPLLRADEDPEHDTVDLPLLTSGPGRLPDNTLDARRAPNRVRDGVQFLAETQRLYFRDMRAYLREIGLHVPVTAVVSNNVVPDIASVAQECDFTAENWYGDGGNEDPHTPGVSYYGNRNPLRDDTPTGFAPFTAALRWNNKPVVVREWATSWPNHWRSASVPEALAYASLQDYDAILLFGYQTNRAPNGAEAEALNDYAFQSDPTTWGLYGLAGHAFLSGAIRPAAHTIALTYPEWRLYSWPNLAADLYRAAWCVRVNSVTGTSGQRDHITPPTNGGDMAALHGLFEQLARRGAPCKAQEIDSGIWRSDTEEMVYYSHSGRLEVRTPTLAMVAGEFSPDQIYKLGRLRFQTPTRCGALLALSLDGLPLEQSRHLVFKMASRAENTGERLEKAPPGSISDWVLRAAGKAPVLTYGRASSQPTHIWFEPVGDPKKPAPAPNALLALWMVDGTWELHIENGRSTLLCDTAGINGLAQGRGFTTTLDATLMTAATDRAADAVSR